MNIEELVAAALPKNATTFERALSETLLERVEELELVIDELWNPLTCPKELLPHLAYSLSADEWNPEWPEAVQRTYLSEWPSIVRLKGTPQSVLRTLKAAGYSDATLTEASELPRIGGAPPLGESWRLGPTGEFHWADYWIDVSKPITLKAARNLTSIVRATAPEHCRLRGISVRKVHFTIGDGLWALGEDITLGATYNWEALNA